MPASSPWWQRAVFYQIYPRSFASSRSGVGDLAGITAHLDDLVWLGVDAIWISPFFPSPMKDFGYDVSDYCGVDPIFGDIAEFDALLEAAHKRGLRVIIDWVPAHTSSAHPWFIESRSSRSNPKRDWYIWSDPNADGSPPNNWRSTFTDGAPAWTLDESTGQLYLHSFLPDQPDLNWANPDVRAAMLDTLRFWLDRGVDGFRADVVHNIGHDPQLESVPDSVAAIPHCVLNDEPATHEYLREIRALLDSYPNDRMMVGEVFLLDPHRMATYYGNGDELHMGFNFPPIFLNWEAEAWKKCIETTFEALDSVAGWPTWVLSNHDFPRHRTRYGGGERRARAAAILLAGLRGTPFLYMGEELGLEDAKIPDEAKVDPGGRDGCRAPIPWVADGTHGWPSNPWLPFPPEAPSRSWLAQKNDARSMLAFYRRLLAMRRASPALTSGSFEWIQSAPDVLVWRRRDADDERVVVVSFAKDRHRVSLDRPYLIDTATGHQLAGAAFDGTVDADGAFILQPA